MGTTKTILIISSILILYVTISWYGNLNSIYENKVNEDIPYRVSYEDAKRLLIPPIYEKYEYFYKKTFITTYRRTLIPFNYKKDKDVLVKKEYYHNN